MAELRCKRCGAAMFVKNGTVRGHQRYRCKACGCNFTATPGRGKPAAMKALAVLLYALGNASQGMIARLLGVSHGTVYRWLRAAGEAAPVPPATPSAGIVQIDEMWHFVNGKNPTWLWRAYDPVARRTLAWELGGRDDATCRRLLDRIGIEGQAFLTDDWEGFHRLVPQEQLFTGKALTFPIEQDNGNIRHDLARFRRRSKVTSRADPMVETSLRLLHHLLQPENFLFYRHRFLSIFG